MKSRNRESDQSYAETLGRRAQEKAKTMKVPVRSRTTEVSPRREPDYSQDRVGGPGVYKTDYSVDSKASAAKRSAMKTAKDKVSKAQMAQSREQDYRTGLRFKNK